MVNYNLLPEMSNTVTELILSMIMYLNYAEFYFNTANLLFTKRVFSILLNE